MSVWKRLAHDQRVVAFSFFAALPGSALALLLLWTGDFSPALRGVATTGLGLSWLLVAIAIRNEVVRPLGTLANMLAALREGDFSLRARVEDASDPLSLAFMEVNQLEDLLQHQRIGAVEATETLRKVLEAIDVAVFAFDPEETLRLVNRAGERLLAQPADNLIGASATDLRFDEALEGPTPRTIEVSFPGGTGRWELRRSVVRQEGFPLKLIALSDLSRALREEERLAWKRIIRVLSHEINNSLAPIKSIAGSLKSVLQRQSLGADLDEDVERGLGVISSRAESLGRFMASYADLARLPKPVREQVEVRGVVRGVADLETRLAVEVADGEAVTVVADPDQLEQALINLIRNAVDATLDAKGETVRVSWQVSDDDLHILIDDEGNGIADTANLFVPFFTTKPGGSGIGLALSQQIVEGHGGTLDLENRAEGTGARARIVLPIEVTS